MVENPHTDDQMASRKKDHIDLAFESQISQINDRFYYEPMLAAHPEDTDMSFEFLGKKLGAPLWVSSMTGGTTHAKKINKNLARVCREYRLGFGLGSCRALLDDDNHLEDFDVRSIIGEDLPFYANLGIAQVEEVLEDNKSDLLDQLIDKLSADGLIVHVNPSQEWLQPEGDRFKYAPLDTIKRLLDVVAFPIIVKEVGQGIGFHSLLELLQLPLRAIEFAAHGGTNFAMLELLRGDSQKLREFKPLVHLGHNAEQMVDWCNEIKEKLEDRIVCREIIVSGGIRSFLDGYYLINKLRFNCVYGQAAPFLKHAQNSYEDVKRYVEYQIAGLQYAQAFLKIKE